MQTPSIIALATAILAIPAAAAPAKTSPIAVANVVAVDQDFMGNKTETPVQVPFGKLTHVDGLPITELQLKSVTVHVDGITAPDVEKVTCQRYQDQYGIQQGSKKFTHKSPAYIATNPVDFGWVLCYVEPVYQGPSKSEG